MKEIFKNIFVNASPLISRSSDLVSAEYGVTTILYLLKKQDDDPVILSFFC